ncbi:MAG: nicotinate-nucleotide diphosphorylase (carboxylating) [Candidatus Melainabacteria bacterium 35_41]|nr:MAG: nicotinate-nucleotide diphosphorylase (carboxylating) [Candidatus Melainabacteria bacterium 35_41]
MLLSKFYIEDHVKMALEEDIGFGDITTENLADDNDFLSGELNTRSEGVLCGCEVFKTVFKVLSDDIKIKFYFKDGDKIKKGDKIADISGPAKYLLMGERVSLNYIQRMSGIATETRKYQDAIEPYAAKIVDTRKTTPNFRAFEKYSVKIGGGALHRFNLSDCAMIKDNHIRLAGSITNAVTKLRESISHAHKIEVECDTLEQVKEAVDVKADIIMLDNMSVDTMRKAVEIINHKAVVEASGNVNLETVNAIASTGVDIISSSAIVAKAPTLDLGLDI